MFTLLDMLKDYLKHYLKRYCNCYSKIKYSKKYLSFLESHIDHKYFAIYTEKDYKREYICSFSECKYCGHIYFFGKLPEEEWSIWLKKYYKSFNKKYFIQSSRIEDFRNRLTILLKDSQYLLSTIRTRKY